MENGTNPTLSTTLVGESAAKSVEGSGGRGLGLR